VAITELSGLEPVSLLLRRNRLQ